MPFPIDVAALVGDIPPASVTIRTYGATAVDDYGDPSATPTDATRSVVVHPTGRRTLERMGMDTKRETISVYSLAPIETTDARQPSRILYDARWYEVSAMGDYATLGGLYLVHAQLLDVGAW